MKSFDTKSNGNYRKSITIHSENVVKSIAFDKKSIAFDTKSIGNELQSINQ